MRARFTSAMSSLPQRRTACRRALDVIEDDGSHAARVSGGDAVARLCRQRPRGGSRMRVGTSSRCAWPRGTTPGGHVSRSPVCVQWTETLGRHAASGRPNASSTRRSTGATRPDLAHEFGLAAADGRRGVGRAPRAGLSSGPTARTEYDGRGVQSPRLPPAPRGESHTPQEDARDRRPCRPQQKKDTPTAVSEHVKRLRIAGQATVPSGDFARRGLTRGDPYACDHDLGCTAHSLPCGIVEEDTGQLRMTFGSSYKTSDCIVDGLAAQWTA